MDLGPENASGQLIWNAKRSSANQDSDDFAARIYKRRPCFPAGCTEQL
jgi:hypothetical protein